MKLPHRWVRRILIWPIPVIATFFYLTAVPLLLILAFLVSYRLPGKLRAVRALGLATVYLFVEAVVMVVGFVLWLASGFGWKTKSPGALPASSKHGHGWHQHLTLKSATASSVCPMFTIKRRT